MFDIGWTELLLVGIVALIVVGPKDLPGMFRTLGRMSGKMKAMARDFQRAMDDAADEAGVSDVASDLKGLTSARNLGLDKLDDAAKSLSSWDSGGSQKAVGSETAKLAQKRAEDARKVHASAAAKAATGADEAKAAGKSASAKSPAKKTTAKKTTAKTGTAKKPAAKITTAKTTAAKAPAAKAPAKKPAAKPAAAKTSAKTAAKSTPKASKGQGNKT